MTPAATIRPTPPEAMPLSITNPEALTDSQRIALDAELEALDRCARLEADLRIELAAEGFTLYVDGDPECRFRSIDALFGVLTGLRLALAIRR